MLDNYNSFSFSFVLFTIANNLFSLVQARTMTDNASKPAYAPGTICHIELPCSDLTRARHFYESVFGWKTTSTDCPGYALFDSNVPGLSNNIFNNLLSVMSLTLYFLLCRSCQWRSVPM